MSCVDKENEIHNPVSIVVISVPIRFMLRHRQLARFCIELVDVNVFHSVFVLTVIGKIFGKRHRSDDVEVGRELSIGLLTEILLHGTERCARVNSFCCIEELLIGLLDRLLILFYAERTVSELH